MSTTALIAIVAVALVGLPTAATGACLGHAMGNRVMTPHVFREHFLSRADGI
jgi:hypothetical protein